MIRRSDFRVAALAVAVLSATSLAGWDGQRQGFLLGIGAGAASVSYQATESKSTQYSFGTPAIASRLGYAWSNTWAVELYGNNAFASNSTFGYSGLGVRNWGSEEAQSNSWSGGLGLMTYSTGVNTDAQGQYPSSYGFGGSFGYGFEFAKHASIDLNMVLGFLDIQDYSRGATSWEKDGSSQGTLLASFSVTVNLLGY